MPSVKCKIKIKNVISVEVRVPQQLRTTETPLR